MSSSKTNDSTTTENVWDVSLENNEDESTATTSTDNTTSYTLADPSQKPKRSIDKSQTRSIRVPANRYSALKSNWESIYVPIVEKLELQIRMNTKRKSVELRVCMMTKHVRKMTSF